MDPKISILVTTYNFEPYIAEAVRSLLAQEGGYSYEVIVVDDCSTDGTEAVLRELEREDSRLSYIRNERNRGAVWSANRAFELARGEYIGRFDGDDVWYPWFLQETVPVLDRHPEVGLVYGDIHYLDASGRTITEGGIERPELPRQGNEFRALLNRHYICAPSMLGRRAAWEAALPYPERLKSGLADWFLTLEMAYCWEFRFVPKALAKYRVHGSGMHHAFLLNGHGERNMRHILDHFTGPAYAPAMTVGDRRRLYAQHYRHYATGYFGIGKSADARRCYRTAWRYQRRYLAEPRFAWLLLGSLLGRKHYDRLKRIVRSA
ncbi:MAG: hypothetical protein RLY31_923 [Bacteroidota bacterium]|jgi:glycosyltransferase involved in cell wall biosynthesis